MSSLKSRKRTERITNALCFIALIFLTCLCMLPIWWIFRSSLMSNAELFKWPPAFFPPRWLFSNYANTLEYFKFWTYLKNTMIIIVPSVIFGTITATMCGYAFARLRFRLFNQREIGKLRRTRARRIRILFCIDRQNGERLLEFNRLNLSFRRQLALLSLCMRLLAHERLGINAAAAPAGLHGNRFPRGLRFGRRSTLFRGGGSLFLSHNAKDWGMRKLFQAVKL